MDAQTLRQIILHRQHLTNPAGMHTVCRGLCGIQAQMHNHSVYTLAVRCDHPLPSGWEEQFIKTWTHRGTLHFFAPEELPLYLHEGRVRQARQVDSLDADPHISAKRKQFFARVMLDMLQQGPQSRAALKTACREKGMTAEEEKSLFDGWGGLLYPLSRLGMVSHVISSQKDFRLMPAFAPMKEKEAKREMLRRYFTAYGPVTVNDAVYFFRWTKADIRGMMEHLPLRSLEAEGRQYFYAGDLPEDLPRVPAILLPGGFDPLMLGYRKEESLFLPRQYLRGIYNLAGMVFPPVLVHGQVAGRWKQEKKAVTFTMFKPLNKRDRAALERKAEKAFPGKEILVEG